MQAAVRPEGMNMACSPEKDLLLAPPEEILEHGQISWIIWEDAYSVKIMKFGRIKNSSWFAVDFQMRCITYSANSFQVVIGRPLAGKLLPVLITVHNSSSPLGSVCALHDKSCVSMATTGFISLSVQMAWCLRKTNTRVLQSPWKGSQYYALIGM